MALTATNAYGNNTNTKNNYITVTSGGSAPVANFTADNTAILPAGTVNFTDSSTNSPTSWSWTFGDGGTSTAQNPSHTYTATGYYTVALKATNAYGNNTNTKTNYIMVCQEVILTPTTPGITWTYFSYAEQAPLNQHTVSGSINSIGAADGNSWVLACDTTADPYLYRHVQMIHTCDTQFTPSQVQKVAFEFKAEGSAVGGPQCLYTLATKGDATQSYLLWPTSPYPGSCYSIHPFDNVWHQDYIEEDNTFMDANGVVKAQWETSSRTVDYTLTVDMMRYRLWVKPEGVQIPGANFSGTPTSGAPPLAVTFTDASTNFPTAWSWSFGDSTTSTVQNPSHTYNSAGTYTVALTATNYAGNNTSTKTGYITVTSSAPVANFTGTPTIGAPPLAVSFTDTSTNSPTSWSWNFGDSNTSTAQNPEPHL